MWPGCPRLSDVAFQKNPFISAHHRMGPRINSRPIPVTDQLAKHVLLGFNQLTANQFPVEMVGSWRKVSFSHSPNSPMSQLYYAGPNRQSVAVADDAIDAMLKNDSLSPASLVWAEGMAEWKTLQVVRPGLIKTGPPSLPGVIPLLNVQAIDGATRSHEIDYKIIGDDMQIVEIELDPKETVIAEAGSMNYKEAGIEFETKIGDGSNPKAGFMDKLMGVRKRVLTGESHFMTHFTNRATLKQSVAFAAPYPGKIIPMDLTQFNGELFSDRCV
jgi:hypothetical protein